MSTAPDFRRDWKARLDHVVDMMRDMSRQAEPQAMVREYGRRITELSPRQDYLSVSRRGLEYPKFRVTRSSRWTEPVNPWEEPHKLPILEGGMLAKIIYSNEPHFDNDFTLDPNDPIHPYLGGNRSIVGIPHFDGGEALNYVLIGRDGPDAFDSEEFPQMVQTSILFGRATHNLVLSNRLASLNRQLERELAVVANLQRSLLPRSLPVVPGLDLAAHYQTSRHAGGDYYDVFRRPDGRWGLFIADVSGHGAPAAVLMAVTHSLAHTIPYPPDGPASLLTYLNQHLTELYTSDNGMFVTAFHAIYDPATRTLEYASAGHNPPRLLSDCRVSALEEVGGVPLGVFGDSRYDNASHVLERGDTLLMYTDGITEAYGTDGTLYGTERLDALLTRCCPPPGVNELIAQILEDLNRHTDSVEHPSDDQTLLAARMA